MLVYGLCTLVAFAAGYYISRYQSARQTEIHQLYDHITDQMHTMNHEFEETNRRIDSLVSEIEDLRGDEKW